MKRSAMIGWWRRGGEDIAAATAAAAALHRAETPAALSTLNINSKAGMLSVGRGKKLLSTSDMPLTVLKSVLCHQSVSGVEKEWRKWTHK